MLLSNRKPIHIEGNFQTTEFFLRAHLENRLQYLSNPLSIRKLSTMIVTRGTLRKGCVLVAGLAHAKVRGLFDHNNQPIDVVTPGVPTEILGWRELPSAGDLVLEVENERKANSVLQFRNRIELQKKAEADLDAIDKNRKDHDVVYQERRKLTKREKVSLRYKDRQEASDDPTPKLNVIIKADVHGSVEAILDVLDTYDASELCHLNIVHYGVGAITDSDIELAKTFNAIIYGFSIQLPIGKSSGVTMRAFDIIYRLIEDVTQEINNRLPEIDVEDIVGEADIQQIFVISERNKKIPVLGCRCSKGVLKKKLRFKIMRDDECIYDGMCCMVLCLGECLNISFNSFYYVSFFTRTRTQVSYHRCDT